MGVKQDYLEALKWYQLSINHDYPEYEGFKHLGWLYENGYGVKQDLVKAEELYQSAITDGVEYENKTNMREAKLLLKAVRAKIK